MSLYHIAIESTTHTHTHNLWTLKKQPLKHNYMCVTGFSWLVAVFIKLYNR